MKSQGVSQSPTAPPPRTSHAATLMPRNFRLADGALARVHVPRGGGFAVDAVFDVEIVGRIDNARLERPLHDPNPLVGVKPGAFAFELSNAVGAVVEYKPERIGVG